jgi:signal peptidase I
MADDQRDPATTPTDQPAASPDPEASAPAPAEAPDDPRASEPTAAAGAHDPAPDEPVSPTTLPESADNTPAPASEASAPATSTVAAEPIALGTATPPPVAAASGAAAETIAPIAASAPEMGAVAAVQTPAPAAEATDPPTVVPAAPAEPAAEADDEQPATGRRALTFFREFVETILLTLVIFVAVRTLVVNFRVDGESMRPTLVNGEYLLVNRATYFHFDLNALRNILPGPDRQGRDVVYLFGPPDRGDIIVFEPPDSSDKPFVKRVIGLPGDTIAVREDHRVYVNGQPLEEGYIAAPPQSLFPANGGTYTVPPGKIFVMGDNRNNSRDSRSFDAVSLDSVIGKAVISYWPLDDFGFIPHERYALAETGR